MPVCRALGQGLWEVRSSLPGNWQIEKAMKKQRLTKAEMARRMETSRSQLDRLLDPDSNSVTLETLTRAARAIGRQVKLELV
jgi:plasmid maintenance system antidote protein VapI